MTKSERAAFRRQMAQHELQMLDRIEHHGRKLAEEGKTSVSSPEWIASQRRRIAKILDARPEAEPQGDA